MSDDLARYSRQTLLPGFGERGQRRLLGSHALVVGCGALGCVASDLLVRGGVGRVTLIDRDVVETSNLHRQILFDEADAAEGLPKAEAARRRLARVNSGVRVAGIVADLEWRSAERLALDGPHGRPDVIVDGLDNYETRFLLNDLAVKHGIPYVYAGVVSTHGMVMPVVPDGARGETAGGERWGSGRPCLRCLFEEAPPAGSQPTCETVGVLGPAVTVVGGLASGEAFKILLGAWEAVSRRLVEVDLWRGERRDVPLDRVRDPACPCCARRRFDALEGRLGAGAATLCGQDAVQVPAPAGGGAMDLAAVASRLGAHGDFTANAFLLRGELAGEPADPGASGGGRIAITLFADGRAIVRGTRRPERARAIYARYIGS